MFWSKWFLKKPTSSDETLKDISDLLFPPIKNWKDEKGNEYLIDTSADMNLEAALIDLKNGMNDEAVHTTIESVLHNLVQLRSKLNKYSNIEDGKFLVVENMDIEK